VVQEQATDRPHISDSVRKDTDGKSLSIANGVKEEVALARTGGSQPPNAGRSATTSDSCPTFGARLTPIVYGFPGDGTIEQAERVRCNWAGTAFRTTPWPGPPLAARRTRPAPSPLAEFSNE
jgi:hypothetical protein